MGSNDDCLYSKSLFGRRTVDPSFLGRSSSDASHQLFLSLRSKSTLPAVFMEEDDDQAESLCTEYEESCTVPLKTIFSKYDFVKVQVFLSEEHHYVLSRYLISRVLTSIRVKGSHAVKIAMDLKKKLVDANRMKITQKELEIELFLILKEFGYEAENVHFYEMMNSFHCQRVPMIILIGGSARKSSVAMALAERLNIPSVLKTDIYCDLFSKFAHLTSISKSSFSSPFEYECKLVQLALSQDISKCAKEGKNLIIEGEHVDANLVAFISSVFAGCRNSEGKGIIIPFNLGSTAPPPFISLVIDDHSIDFLHSCILEKMKSSYKNDFIFIQ